MKNLKPRKPIWALKHHSAVHNDRPWTQRWVCGALEYDFKLLQTPLTSRTFFNAV